MFFLFIKKEDFSVLKLKFSVMKNFYSTFNGSLVEKVSIKMRQRKEVNWENLFNDFKTIDICFLRRKSWLQNISLRELHQVFYFNGSYASKYISRKSIKKTRRRKLWAYFYGINSPFSFHFKGDFIVTLNKWMKMYRRNESKLQWRREF